MSLVPTLDLFKDSSGPVTYWWLDVGIAADGDYEIQDHGTIPSSPNPGEEFHMGVNLCGVGSGVTSYTVLLGEIPLHPVDGEVHVDLLDQAQVSQGGGIVKAKDATESTRPTP